MEKRKYGRRAPVEAEASIQSGSGRVKAKVVNLGIGGLALETEPGVELERFLRLRVRLLPARPPLDVDAIVRRRENRARATRWGLELVNPSTGALALIEDCLDRHGAAAQEPPVVEPEVASKAEVDAAALKAAENRELHGLFQSALESLDF